MGKRRKRFGLMDVSRCKVARAEWRVGQNDRLSMGGGGLQWKCERQRDVTRISRCGHDVKTRIILATAILEGMHAMQCDKGLFPTRTNHQTISCAPSNSSRHYHNPFHLTPPHYQCSPPLPASKQLWSNSQSLLSTPSPPLSTS